jgi:hypothetical protein
MDIHDAHERGIEIISFWFFGVQYLYIVCATRNAKYFAVEKVGGELLSLKSCRGDNKSEIISFFDYFLQNTKQHISMDGSFMSFVKHYN